jgi:hypothetical protein
MEINRVVILINSCFFESMDRTKNTPIIGRNVINVRIGRNTRYSIILNIAF